VPSFWRAGLVFGMTTVLAAAPQVMPTDAQPHKVVHADRFAEDLRTGHLYVPPTTTTTTTTTTIPSTTTTTSIAPAQLVSDAVMAQWDKVAMCEEGGNWTVRGASYSGGLGISNTNWVAYGGTQYAYSAADATPEEQVAVAERIQSSPPDQNGCASW
jgi:hypothetical protein